MAKPLLTKAQLELFKQNNSGKSLTEMTKWVNKTFNMSLTEKQVCAIRCNNKIRSGVSGRFTKDQTPWNKGKHTAPEKFLEHSFKKGQAPMPRRRELFSEKNYEGFIKIKVAEPNVWKLKHHYVWEQAYGKIPKGKVILFLDGDKTNCDLSNLRLVDHRVQSTVAIRKLSSSNKDINKAGILVTELEYKIKDKQGGKIK